MKSQNTVNLVMAEHLEQRHSLLLSALGEGVYGIDQDGLGTFVNKAAEEILGWSEQEVLGKPLHDLHHHTRMDGSHYPREECPIYAALTDGEIHQVADEIFWHANGKAIPVEYTSTPIIEDDAITGAVVVFRDVTDQRAMEAEREASLAEITHLKDLLEQERDYLRDEIRAVGEQEGHRGIIGSSEALRRTLAQIDAVAATPMTVLVQGESGVGKEGIARVIHEKSQRADEPLVKVNCASIPAELFESEFFGHVKGAFTGAHQDRVGRLQLADGGTLFLDEIGEIPLGLQSKLLRALQEQEFERVGEDVTRHVDVRVVAATNRDLTEEVKAGRFREDLYYRLSVFPIEVPPLRERKEDIGPLALHFLDNAITELGREPINMTQRQLEGLKSHDWPGNVRELKNVIERAVILSPGQRLKLDAAFGRTGEVADDSEAVLDFRTEAEFRELEKRNLILALEAAGWKISGEGGVAELMGLKPSTVAYRMKQFGIERSG